MPCRSLWRLWWGIGFFIKRQAVDWAVGLLIGSLGINESEESAFQYIILPNHEANCVNPGRWNGMNGTASKKSSRYHKLYWILLDRWFLSTLLTARIMQIKRAISILQ